MYGYYFLAALGPSVTPYLWWKKYLTRVQLIQFAVVFGHSLQLVVRECDYPKHLVACMCLNTLVFMVLFSNFYRKSYVRKDNADRCITKSTTMYSSHGRRECQEDASVRGG